MQQTLGEKVRATSQSADCTFPALSGSDGKGSGRRGRRSPRGNPHISASALAVGPQNSAGGEDSGTGHRKPISVLPAFHVDGAYL